MVLEDKELKQNNLVVSLEIFVDKLKLKFLT